MKTLSFFILCILAGLPPLRAAVPGEVRGAVFDAVTGEAVAGCIVKTTGSFTHTDNKGLFVLTPGAAADSVSFRCLGYRGARLPLRADMGVVRLYPETTQLKDVIVQAPDIYARGDTLVFDVSKYATAKDNAIIDVIRRLPDIKVEEDGTIKYQGKPINKFYIDGNDFIGGQYNLATDNISHKDVASVEVMENHQPVKALEGIEFPEEAGLNLKLKEGARSRWVGSVRASAGVEPVLFSGSVYTMRIGTGNQSIATLKADNTGWNPANEIQEHDFAEMFSSDYRESLWREYISADITAAPLSDKRTRDNVSWLANAITAWKKDDTSMRLMLGHTGDRLDYNSAMNTYYFSDCIPDFISNDNRHVRRHDITAQFYSETNKPGYYLKDKLSVTFGDSDTDCAVTGTLDIFQRVRRRNFSAVNDLKLVRRNEKKLFTLLSRTSACHRPDRLLINGEEEAMQNIAATEARNTTETRLGRLTRFWKYYVTAGLDFDYRRLNSTLAGKPGYDNSGCRSVLLSNLYATPQIDYERNGWRGSLRVALKWLHYSVEGHRDRLNVSPRLYIKRQLSARSDISATLAYQLIPTDAFMYLSMPVLADYRNLFVGRPVAKYSGDAAATVSYRFRNPLKSLFLNMSFTYNYSRSRMMPDRLFIGDMIVTTYERHLHERDMYSWSGSFSKGLGHSKMIVGSEANVTATSATSMRDKVALPFRQFVAGIKPYFKGSLMRWLSVNYEAEYEFTRLRINGQSSGSHSLHQSLSGTVLPDDNLQFSIGAEHFLTRFPDGETVSLTLPDCTAEWRVNSKTRLILSSANLLDRRWYGYVTYGTLSRTEHGFRIRPRTVLATVQYRF